MGACGRLCILVLAARDGFTWEHEKNEIECGATSLLRKNRRDADLREGRTCDVCAGLAPDDLPRSYGWGRVTEGDRSNIVTAEMAHGSVVFLVCLDCYRRGARWRAQRLASLGAR